MVDFEDDIKNCIRVLNEGGTILYPTDTVWGLGCDAMNADAVDKVFKQKHRPKDKSMIVLLADARDILQYVAAPPPDIISIVENFTRPTTVIYGGALGFAESVINKEDSVAIRVTTDPFCRALIKRFKRPIISTSANISGEITPTTYRAISAEILNNADYVVKYRQDDDKVVMPSRIVKVSDDGDIIILRA